MSGATLLVDIGNTRVKWAVLRGGRVGRVQALAHDGSGIALQAVFRRTPRLARVVAVSVAGRGLERALDAAARRACGLRPEFLRATREACGVRNGYREVWRLGVDRWMAVIGAHTLLPGRDVLIANVGTALTVDLVTAEGRHRGGAIVPGPATMIASLLYGTHGIRRRAQGTRASVRRLFAADTASALAAGATVAAAAFIDRAALEAGRLLGRRPRVLLSGGAAADVRRHLRANSRVIPDLVLRGLAACAAAG